MTSNLDCKLIWIPSFSLTLEQNWSPTTSKSQNYEICPYSFFSTEAQEEDYWVELLAKRSAVELITNGRVGYDTMNNMTCLSNSAFTSCVKRASIIASQLNDAVQTAEKSVESEDLDPKYLMD